MSLFGLIEKRESLANPGAILNGFFGGRATESGLSINEQNALTYTTVYACVQVISEAMAALPIRLYRRTDDGHEMVESPLAMLVGAEPNPEMGSASMAAVSMGWVLTWGNGYAEIERNNAGEAIALHPLAPNRVIPRRRQRTGAGGAGGMGGADWRIEYYLTRGPILSPYSLEQVVTNPDPIDRDDMLHFAGLGFDGIMGYSPIAMAREAVGLGLAAQAYGARFFGNSGVPSGVLESDKIIKNPGKLREAWQKANGGGAQRGTAVLEDGVKFKPIGIPPEDSQFLETRKFQRSDVCGIYRVPPHMIGDLDRSTNNNIEHQGMEFVRYCLGGWIARNEQEYNRKLLTREQRAAGYFFAYDVDALQRGDFKTRAEGYAQGLNWGWLSPDEVRAREKLNRLPEGQGQIYLRPLNMVPANLPADQVKKQQGKGVTVDENGGLKVATDGETPPPPPPPPLNGAQITAAVDLIGKLRSGTIASDAAVELLVGMGIERARAQAMAAATGKITGGGPEDRDFVRDLLKAFAGNSETLPLLLNALELQPMLQTAALPANKAYDEPYLPVLAPISGSAPVSGQTLKDSDGSIVGGALVKGSVPASDGGGVNAGTAESQRGHKWRTNSRALLIDAAGRAVRRQAAALERMAKLPAEKRAAEQREFYVAQGDYLRDTLLPIAAALADLADVPFATARNAVESVAQGAEKNLTAEQIADAIVAELKN